MGENFVLNEIAGRFGDLLLFVAEILGGKDVTAEGFGDQKLATFFQLFTHGCLALTVECFENFLKAFLTQSRRGAEIKSL